MLFPFNPSWINNSLLSKIKKCSNLFRRGYFISSLSLCSASRYHHNNKLSYLHSLRVGFCWFITTSPNSLWSSLKKLPKHSRHPSSQWNICLHFCCQSQTYNELVSQCFKPSSTLTSLKINSSHFSDLHWTVWYPQETNTSYLSTTYWHFPWSRWNLTPSYAHEH